MIEDIFLAIVLSLSFSFSIWAVLTGLFFVFDFKHPEPIPVLISFIAGLNLLVIFIRVSPSHEKLSDREFLNQKYHELIEEENK